MGFPTRPARSLRPPLGLLAALGVLAFAGSAEAIVAGTTPSQYQRFNKIFGSAESTGNTLMIDSHGRCSNVNDTLLPQSEAFIRTVPQGSELLGAYLFWSGSLTSAGVDNTVDFTVADGTAFRNQVADQCQTINRQGGYFYCRKDVTALVRPHPGSQAYNGGYFMGGVSAQPGQCDPDGTCQTDPFCQGRYAGWSLIVVWRDPLGNTARDVLLYDGFQNLDETQGSPGVSRFTISGFEVGNPAVGEIAYFGMEGDASLGVPPQDNNPDPAIQCATCFDYFQVNGTKLSDGFGWPNNVFNSSTANGIDLDKFNIGQGGFSVLQPGATSIAIELGSGDGVAGPVAEPGGGGESFFVGWVLLTLDTLAPNFSKARTFKSVDPATAAVGDVLQYQIVVTNEGSLAATNVIVQDAIPANTTYVAGSTRIDNGTPLPDVSGTSPLVSGLNLGTIDFRGDNDRQVTFRVRVNGSLPAGVTQITNTAAVRSDQLPTPRLLTATTSITQTTAQLGQPTKAAVPLAGAQVKPGDSILYTVTIPNSGQRAAQGVSYVDDLPAFVRNFRIVSVNAGPDAQLVFTPPPAGTNGRGRLTVSSITAPAQSAATISYSVTVDTVAEFAGNGIALADIDGKEIVNQGSVTAPMLPSALVTDDPNTTPSPDPTKVVIQYAPRITATKGVTDANGSPAEPGDTLTYEIRFANAGNLRGTISFTDDLPAGVGAFAIGSCPAGATCGFSGNRLTVQNLVVPEGGNTASLTFTVRINDPIANATAIQNCASFTVQEAPRQNGQTCSPTLTASALAILSASTKSVTDQNGGDVESSDSLTYTIVVRNTGNQPANNVIVTDSVDATNLEAVAPAQGGTFAGGTITWNPATTPALLRVDRAGSVTLTFTARVKATVTSGTVISNQARLVSTEIPGGALSDDPATPAAGDPTSVTVRTQPRFTTSTKVARDENGGSVEPGDLLTYTLVVTNSGRGAAADVVVVDPIDTTALQNVSPGQGGAFAGNQITWNATTTPALASLASGSSVTLTFQARVTTPLDNGRVISNQARITSREVTTPQSTDDPATPAANDPTLVTVRSAANASTSTKGVVDQNGGVAQPGDALTYTIVVKNTGNAPIRNASVTDVIEVGLINVVPAQGGRFDAASRTITWDGTSTTALARVVPGTDVTLTFTASIAAGLANGTLLSNQARIASADLAAPAVTDDPSTPTLGDPTRITVLSRPDFVTSTKTFSDGNGGAPNPGDVITWSIIVVNSGTTVGTNLVVSDVIDVNLTDVVPGQGGRFDAATRTIVWDAASTPALANLGPQTRTALTFTSRISAPLDNGTVIRNQALVRSTEVTVAQPTDDPSTPPAGDATQLVVVSAADLSGSPKTVEDLNGGAVKPGETLRYTIAVTNRGTATAQNVVVTDVIDASLENVAPGSGGRFDAASRTITWDTTSVAGLARVVPGAAGVVSLSFTASVRASLDNGTVIANQARFSVSAAGTPMLSDDPRTADVNDPTRVTVVSGADFANTTLVVRDENGGAVEPNDFLTYTLTIANSGDGPGTNVVATIPIDANLTDVAPGAGGTFNAATRILTFSSPGVAGLLRLDAGSQVVVTFRARIVTPLDNNTVISEQARISATGLVTPVPSDDPSTPALDDPTRLTVVSRAGFTATMTVTDENGGSVVPGDTLLYAITITNTGTAPLRNVVVQDPIPASTQLTELLDGATDQNGVITWNATTTPALALVAPGRPAVVRVRHSVVIPTANGTVISSQGLASPEGISPQRTDDPSTPTPLDPTRVTVVSAPNLSRSIKAVVDQNGGSPEPGDDLQYVITVRNDGTDIARTLTVTDVIDANVINITPQDGGTFDAPSRTVTWTSATTPALLALRPNEQVLLRVNVRILSPLDNGTVIRNQGRIVTPSLATPVLTDNPATPAQNDPTDITVLSAPNFADTTKVVVDDNGGLLRPGDRLTYTIVVRNSGKAVGRDVAVRDAVPAPLAAIAAEQGGRVTGSNIEWNGTTTPALASLAPGASVTLIFHATVPAGTANGTVLRNQAQVTSREVTAAVNSDDPATPTRGDPTIITVATPDFSRSVKDYVDENGGDVNPGDRIAYTLLVRNTGSRDGRNVVVTDRIDANLIEVTADSGGRIQNGVVTWDPTTTPALATMAPNASVTLTVRARVRELLRNGVVVSNQAQIGHADDTALTPSDNPRTTAILGDSTDFTVVASPNMKPFFKSVADESGGDVQPGDFVTYTLRVRNAGTTFATNVVVSDPVDAALTEVAPGQGGVLGGRTITWSAATTPALAQVNPAQEVALTFRARVSTAAAHNQRISNQASVRAEEVASAVLSDDPATTQIADDPTTITVVANPVFTETTKTVRDDNGGNVDPGDTLTYTITIRNTGPRDGERVTYSDPVPTGTVYVAGSTRLNGVVVPDGTGGFAPAAAGMLVANAGAPAGTVRASQQAVILYQLRVLPTTQAGTIIQNQGSVTSSLTGPVLTDNPTTPELDDPTTVIVGVGVNLKSTQMTARLVLDQGTPGVAEIGDILEYTVTIPNNGNAGATGVIFTLPVPDRTSFVPASITYNGTALSDAVDADPGELLPSAGQSPAQVRVRVGDVSARGRATLTFRVKIDAGPLVTAQGDVIATQTTSEKTDADGNDLNGNQPTVTAVGTTPVPALDVTKEALDVNGGSVQPGDVIEYSLTFRNTGNTRFQDLAFEDDIPAGLSFVASSASQYPGATVAFDPPPQGVGARGKLRVSNLALDAGRDLRFVFRATVGPATACGTRVENVASFTAAGVTRATTNRKSFVVCGGLGSAAVKGVVFQDRGARNKRLEPNDYRLAGFQVLAYLAERPASPTRTAVSDNDGAFALFDLPPGLYFIKVFSNTGAEFAKVENVRIEEGVMLEQNLLIDPRGIVYDSTTGGAVEGVSAFLYFDDTNALDPGKLVPPDFLGERQQAQRTNAQGMYQFDARAGHKYKLVLQPAGQAYVFPSTLIAPQTGFAQVTLPDNTVVPNARPERSGATTYYLRFNLASAADAVFNNHVPLDPLTSLIRLDKRANKRVVTVGGIVSYTVKVQNLSTKDFIDDVTRNLTPVFIQDLLPKGFKYLKGSARAKRQDTSNGRITEIPLANGSAGPQGFATDPAGATGRALRFGPYEMKAGETILVRYQTVAGVTTTQGEYRNRAIVQGPGNVALSNVADALVQVVRDGIFDQGLIVGKVFCDRNGNGVQDKPAADAKPEDRETGIEGARVFIDTGWYAETGTDGKFHLKDIDPGTHLVKVDLDTLPPGSSFTTDERRILYVTRGLPSKIDFGVRCASEKASITSLQVKAIKVPKRGVSRIRVVRGNLTKWTLSVEGKALQLLRADAVVSQGQSFTFSRPLAVLNAKTAKGRLTDPLRFEVRMPAGIAVETWLIRISTSKGEPVHELGGRGVPPREILWDGTDTGEYLLEDGGVYRYQLFLVTEAGAQAISPLHPFAVAYGKKSAATTAHTVSQDTVSGQPFVRRTMRPSKRLLAKLAEIVRRLEQEPTFTLEMEAHTDDRGSRLNSLLHSQRQALELRKRLLRAGIASKRIDSRGYGARRPAVQSASRKARDANRRVVMRLVRPGAQGVFAELPVPETLPVLGDRVMIGEVEVGLDKEGGFERAVVLPPDGVIPIELQRRDGRAIVWYREGAAAKDPRVDVPVRGDITARVVSIGPRPLALPGLQLALAPAESKVTLNAISLPSRMLQFLVRGERFPVASWALEVERLGGEILIARRGGEGFLSGEFTWDGSLDKKPALSAGLYRASLSASDPRGVRYVSAPAEFEVLAAPVAVVAKAEAPKETARKAPRPKRLLDAALPGRLFKGGRTDVVTAALRRALNALAKRILAILEDRPQQRFEILAHTDDTGAYEADVAVTEAQGEAVRSYLKEKKVPALALTLRTFGGKERVAPNTTARNRAKNRRVVVRSVAADETLQSLFGEPKAKKPPVAPPAKPSPLAWPPHRVFVTVAGQRAMVDGAGRFNVVLKLKAGEPIVIDVAAANGARAFAVVPFTETGTVPTTAPSKVMTPGPPVDRGLPANSPQDRGRGASPPRSIESPRAPAKPAVPATPSGLPPPAKRIGGELSNPWMASAWDSSAFRVAMRGGDVVTGGGGETVVRARGTGTGLFSASSSVSTASAPKLVAQAMPAGEKKKDGAIPATTTGAPKDDPPPPPRPGSFGGFGEAEIEAAFSGADLKKLPPVNAAKLNANLPPKGVVIKAREIRLFGDTHVENTLTVNGKEVPVDKKTGRFTATVALPIGKSKIVLRTQDKAGNVGLLEWPVEVSNWSLFVLALGEGVIGQNGVHLDGGTAATRGEYGGKVFLQGRTAIYVKGRIQGKYLFEDVKFTAHFDSAKRKEFEQVFQNIIDPEKWYPVYGDTAKEVKDVNARDKLYVLVEADASKLLIGNFKTQIEGVELFSYDRAFYGLSIDFKKAFKKGYDTGVKVFASRDGEIQQHAHVELRGTGGSIYYLRHEEILEGSEKVKVVVRDRDTGMELYSTPRTLYSDYTMEYRQGRVLMKSTLPSVADANWLVNNNLSTMLGGHPVYLVIDYEYQGRMNESGNTFGLHVRQKIADVVEIGAGHVREGRPGASDPAYQLTGAHVKVAKNHLYAKGEFARSTAVDAQNYISDDGGLTYGNLGNRWDTSKARQGSGNAVKFEAGGDIAKAAGWKDKSLVVKGYFQNMDSGFFSTGKVQDQGQTRYGVNVSFKPTAKDEIILRHDGLTAELYDMGDLSRAARKSSRAVSTAQYTRKEGKWTFIGEYNHTFITDDSLAAQGGGSINDSFGFGATYDLNKRVQLLGRIDAFPRANDRTFVQSGQVGVSPTQPQGGDHVGFTVGARLAITKDTALQITETVRGSGENSTSIGLKTKLSDTANLYIEERLLQRDARVMGTTVLGGEQKVGKDSRAYGEYQLDNGVEGNRNRAVLGAGHRFKVAKGLNVDVSYERSQTFGDALGGKSSRDALSTAFDFLREKWVKASGRYELRMDAADEKVGGQDKLQVLTTNLVDFTATKDLSFLLKLNYSNTDNRTLASTEAEMLEMSAGFAVRPRDWNWFNLLAKYTKFVEQRPVNLTDGFSERVSSDIFSIIPIFDLPKGFQIVEKFAFKREREYFFDLPPGFSDTFLWINRVNYHLTNWIDVSGEFRHLTNLASGDTENGFLFEASVILKKYLRLGLGYNFTRFTDDELVRSRLDNRGVFFRVVGMY